MSTETQPNNNHGIPIVIDTKPYKAPKETMTGQELRNLADPKIAADRDLFEEIPGPGDDKKIADAEVVHLKPGMHFYSAPGTINPGDTPHLPEDDETFLTSKQFKWKATPGYLIIEGLPVASAKYDRSSIDLMIRIPSGYPNAALDMFYVFPEVKLKGGGYPPSAEAFEDHCGLRWQRFSRHLAANAWRPGVDSIKTFLTLVLGELQGKA